MSPLEKVIYYLFGPKMLIMHVLLLFMLFISESINPLMPIGPYAVGSIFMILSVWLVLDAFVLAFAMQFGLYAYVIEIVDRETKERTYIPIIKSQYPNMLALILSAGALLIFSTGSLHHIKSFFLMSAIQILLAYWVVYKRSHQVT